MHTLATPWCVPAFTVYRRCILENGIQNSSIILSTELDVISHVSLCQAAHAWHASESIWAISVVESYPGQSSGEKNLSAAAVLTSTQPNIAATFPVLSASSSEKLRKMWSFCFLMGGVGSMCCLRCSYKLCTKCFKQKRKVWTKRGWHRVASAQPLFSLIFTVC